MRSIEWTERMSVGVPLLDADHKIFTDIINELEHCARYPDRRDAARDALGRLVEYARYHFEREEKVMAACGYPGIDDHDAGDLMAAMAQARDTEYPAVGVF